MESAWVHCFDIVGKGVGWEIWMPMSAYYTGFCVRLCSEPKNIVGFAVFEALCGKFRCVGDECLRCYQLTKILPAGSELPFEERSIAGISTPLQAPSSFRRERRTFSPRIFQAA